MLWVHEDGQWRYSGSMDGAHGLGDGAAEGAVDGTAAAEAAAQYRIDDPRAAGPQTSDSGVA